MKLSEYQLQGIRFLTEHRSALLADDMGLGKTAQAIVAADSIAAKRVLVICPAVARINWQREFNTWSIYGDFSVCEKLTDRIAERCIVSYDFAAHNIARLSVVKWDLVISDETHFAKEPEAKRTKALFSVNGLAHRTKRFWCLTGTPAPNHIGEMWPMLFTFGVTKLNYSSFIERYCNTRLVSYGGRAEFRPLGTKKAMIPEIKEMLSSFMLRRMKADVLSELPPKTFETVTVKGTPLMDVVEADLEKIEVEKKKIEEVFSGSWFSNLDRVAEVLESIGDSVSTLRRYTGLQKVVPVAEMVTAELESLAYDKIIIFGVHTDVLKSLEEELAEFNPVKILGETSPKARQEAVDRFQTDPTCRVFIGNVQAAGTAITLTAASQVLFIEQSWVPGENEQASDRAHRRGQTENVHVRIAAMADSFDEKVSSVLKRKSQELSEIFN